jgi:NDP-sugar pyrophosphorylase family protein
MHFLINSGIYVVSPNLLDIIPDDGEYLMTKLIDEARNSGFKVLGYQFTESWRDIGRLDDYLKAINDLENGKVGDTDGVFM